MSIIKCKMCGGDLAVIDGQFVAECEFCGTKQTLPRVNEEVIQNLFNRANALRLKCEFDKAEQIYEKIIQENDAEPEAHWGIVLCKYGIEYVEDPKTYKRIPTCHRTSYDAVATDPDYLAAIQCADVSQRGIYEAEAKSIDEIQKNILSIVKEEKPFDVFICYKETDENGKRTIDSAIANDIYHQLTQEGLKVFYAAITLEDKLGREYEPYIFAALNSAKVMLVIGTKPQYFSAVWVKNEWSRFLKLMKSDRSKLLIPCYKDMDAYELPEEFAHLQAQDMAKIGFINDIVRGIRKVIVKEEVKAPVVQETVVTESNTNTAPLLKRAFMFLEDGDWDAADEYCEKVLDIDPENAQAYLGKLLAEQRVRKQEDLHDLEKPFQNSNYYQKVMRFSDDDLKATLEGYIDHINARNEENRLEGIYRRADVTAAQAKLQADFLRAAKLFEEVQAYQDSADRAKECREKAEIARKDNILFMGKNKISSRANIDDYEAAIKLFGSISGWKNADALVLDCQEKIAEIKAKEEAARIEKERKQELARQEVQRIAARNKMIAKIAIPSICVVVAFIVLLFTFIIPNTKYNKAVNLMDAGKYAEAAMAFGEIPNYRDAWEQSSALWEKVTVREFVSAGYSHTVGLHADGTAVAVGYAAYNQCDVSDWKGIVAISAGSFHTVGLCADGTVVAVGDNRDGQCDVSDWKDIVAISTGSFHTVGLRADGTVVAQGNNGYHQCDVSDWENIIAISAGNSHTVGLRADGTVVAQGNNGYHQCDVSDWEDIVAISAGDYHTVGICADGTVVTVGSNFDDQNDVSAWKNIVAVSLGSFHTVGLRANGTVVAVGDNNYGQCDVSDWKDIVAISAGGNYTVGLRADGTVVAVGYNGYGQGDVSGWSNIKTD